MHVWASDIGDIQRLQPIIAFIQDNRAVLMALVEHRRQSIDTL